MRNLKKFLALVMAMLMVFGMAVITTGAADDADSEYLGAAQHLAALSIMKGDEHGNLNLENGVTRYQAALFFVQALTGKTDVNTWNGEKKSTIFSDVPEYGTAIDYAYGMKLILGRGNGIYGYNDPITYQDMLVMAVRALGYETEDTTYPYGYIINAQTLGLTDDVDNINFKAELTRGETAQIIWNMLNTEIAFIDPLTNAIVYPGQEDTTPYGLLVGAGKIERTTLLEKAGYADGKLEGFISNFVEANENDEDSVATVDFDYYYIKDNKINEDSVTVAAADLGITEDTPKASYLGLPVTVFVNCAAEEFASDYSIDKDESEASIVFANMTEMTTVENLGDAGSIRFVEPSSGNPYFLIGGTKVALGEDDIVEALTFTEDGWVDMELDVLKDAFAYKTKGGYEDATNSYGQINYFTYKIPDDSGDKIEYETATLLCYTPYEFGQYFVRTIKDMTTSKDADFTTIGKYKSTPVVNLDEEESNFVEVLLGTTKIVNENTTSVSKSNGEKAKSVTLAGEDIKSGDFMFYAYNEVDNILTVAMNCGAFQTGRLSGTSSAKETLKIDGATKPTGIKGAFDDADYFGYDNALAKDIIAALESGKDNVKYIEADGRVIYFESYSGEKSSSAAYDFAIVSMNDSVIADLLDVKVKDLTKVDGLILDSDDNVQVAVLNTETGEWELASLGRFYMGYDADEEEWDAYSDLGTYATLVEMVGPNETEKYKNYAAAKEAFGQGGVFALVSEKDGLYSLGTVEDAVTYNENADGLIYSDDSVKTSKISADPDVDPARVTQNESTITVVVDKDGNVGVRTGIIKANNTYNVDGPVEFFSANSSLIVLRTNNDKVSSAKANALLWAETQVAWTYYLALPGVSSCELDANETGSDEKYTVTLTNVFNYRTRKMVDEISFQTDEAIEFTPDDQLMPTLLFADKDGIVYDYHKAGVQDWETPANMNIYVNISNVDIEEAMLYAWWNTRRSASSSSLGAGADGLQFVDADTVIYSRADGNPFAAGFSSAHNTNLNNSSREMAETVNKRVIATLAGYAYTVNATGLDPEEYDFDRALLLRNYDEADADRWNASYDDEFGGYAFPMNAELIEDLSGGPVSGVFDQFMLDNDGGVIVIPAVDDDDYTDVAFITFRTQIVSIWTDSSSKLELYPMIVYMSMDDDAECTHPSTTVVEDECVDATCTTAGKIVVACNVCGEKIETTIDALGHKMVETAAAVEPTCTEAGKTAAQACTRCDHTVAATEIAALGHKEVEIPAVAPTCTEDGKTAGKKCSVCETVTVEPTVVAATGHTVVDVAEKVATCTEKGHLAYKECSVCKAELTTKIETAIDPNNHDMQEVEGTAKAATCTEAGKAADKKCSRCDYTETGAAIDATGHNWSVEWASDATAHWHECTNANCPVVENAEKDGYAAHTDAKNNDTQAETPDGKCDVCGAALN